MAIYWIQVAVGVWLLVLPWITGLSGVPVMKWSTILAGLVIIVANIWKIFGEEKS